MNRNRDTCSYFTSVCSLEKRACSEQRTTYDQVTQPLAIVVLMYTEDSFSLQQSSRWEYTTGLDCGFAHCGVSCSVIYSPSLTSPRTSAVARGVLVLVWLCNCRLTCSEETFPPLLTLCQAWFMSPSWRTSLEKTILPDP